MEHPHRQRYADLAWGDMAAVEHFGYDVCQPKFDGEWAAVVVLGNQVVVWSRQNRILDTLHCRRGAPHCLLIGEYLSSKRPNGYRPYRSVADGEPLIAVWDCMRWERESLGTGAYSGRLAMAKQAVSMIGGPHLLVAPSVTFAHDTSGEGFIFRRSGDDCTGEIARMKRPDYQAF